MENALEVSFLFMQREYGNLVFNGKVKHACAQIISASLSIIQCISLISNLL
jgi:hypothetical protein